MFLRARSQLRVGELEYEPTGTHDVAIKLTAWHIARYSHERVPLFVNFWTPLTVSTARSTAHSQPDCMTG